MRKSELSKKGSMAAIVDRMRGGSGKGNMNRNDKGVATPRTTTYLTDVAYVIEVSVVVPDHPGWQWDDYCGEMSKHREILTRRLKKGQYHMSPYLGLREFRVDCTLLEDEKDVPPSFYMGRTEGLGYILHHINYPNLECYRSDLEPEAPVFWNAIMKDGRIDCTVEGVTGI